MSVTDTNACFTIQNLKKKKSQNKITMIHSYTSLPAYLVMLCLHSFVSFSFIILNILSLPLMLVIRLKVVSPKFKVTMHRQRQREGKKEKKSRKYSYILISLPTRLYALFILFFFSLSFFLRKLSFPFFPAMQLHFPQFKVTMNRQRKTIFFKQKSK